MLWPVSPGHSQTIIHSRPRPQRRFSTGWLSLIGLLLLFFGCKAADDVTNCVHYLNQKDFQRVAEDETCSTYERASAELGLAGFLFSNFLDPDASDNFRTALGIPLSAEYWKTWPGSTRYENARQLSGDSTGDVYQGQPRQNEDIEIHYFASLGGLLAQTYIELDKNADGIISEAELQAFTAIRPVNDAEYGENRIITADWIQFVQNKEKVFLLNLGADSNGCLPKTATPKFDGIWGSATGYDIDSTECGLIEPPSLADLAAWVAAGEGRIDVSGECAIVTKVEQIQNLFYDGATNPDALSVAELSENYVNYINSIRRDLTDLGLPADSDLRKSLREFSEQLDNGGSCANTTVSQVDQIFSIIGVAADDATTDYRSVNVMRTSDVITASDTPIEIPTEFVTTIEISGVPVRITFACTNADDLRARLIYRSGADYIPNYKDADGGIANTFETLKRLNYDAQGNQKPDIAGDEIISFKELLCMQ